MSLTINTKVPTPLQTISDSFKDQIYSRDRPFRESDGEESPGPLSRPPVSPISPSATAASLPDPPPADIGEPKSNPHPTESGTHTQQLPHRSQPHPELQARFFPQPPPQTEFIDPPTPVALNEEDDTDSAALRAAISILQIQKQKSRHDIKTLQKLRDGLIKDPDSFTEELLSGRLREEKLPNNPLQATFNGNDESADDDEDGEQKVPNAEGEEKAPTDNADAANAASQYPKIPSAQNVVRCPPINWTKYHIAGEPLDRMHEEQRKRPTQGEPSGDQPQQYPFTFTSGPRAREHQVYAPYDPHLDKSTTVAEQMGIGVQTRRTSKKSEFGG